MHQPATTTAPNEASATPARRTTPHRQRGVNLRLLLITVVLLGITVPSAYAWYRLQVQRTAGALLQRVTAFEQEQEWSQVATALSRYLLLRADDSAARVKYAEIYAHLADTFQTRRRLAALLYHALGVEPTRHDLRLKLAETLLQVGKYVVAETEARKVLAADTEDPSAARRVIGLSLVARARRDGVVTPASAATALSEALADRADDVQLATITAHFLRRYPNALAPEIVDTATYADQIIERMLAADPRNPVALVARYQYQKRYAPASAALSDLELALEVDPGYVPALLLAANEAIVADQNNPKAEAYLRRAVEAEPLDPRAYLALAKLLAASGELDHALVVLLQGYQATGKENVDLLAALAAALIDRDKTRAEYADWKDAERYVLKFEDVIRTRSPQLNREARRRLDNRLYILRARLALARGRTGAAIAPLQAVLVVTEREQGDTASPAGSLAIALLAETMGTLGRWDVAADYWDRLVTRLPRQPDFLLRAADAYLKAGQPDEVIDRLERLVQAVPDAAESVTLTLVQAHLLRQLRRPSTERNWAEFLSLLADAQSAVPGRWELVLARVDYLLALDTTEGKEQALKQLRAAEQADHEEPLFWRSLVSAYVRLDATEDAQRALQQYDRLEPSPVKRAVLRSSLLASSKRFDEAEKTLDQLLPTLDAKDRRPIELQRLRLTVAAGQLDAARRQISQLINSSPDDPELLKVGIQFALRVKDLELAQQWETALVKLDEADGFDVRFLRARRMLAMFASLDSRDRDRLVSLVTALRAKRPRWYPIVALAGTCAEARQDQAAAIREYQRAIELGDPRTVTLERLVALLYRKGLYSEAQDYLSRFTARAPGTTGPRLDSLAIALAVKRNQMDEALALAKATADRFPDDAMRQVWLGSLLASSGQQEEAERVLRQAVERFHDDQRVWGALFTFLVLTKQPDAARQVFAQLTDAVKLDEATRHAVRAQGHEMLGENDTARQHYEAALKITPGNVAIRLRLAKLLLSSDIRAATKQFERIVELDPDNDVGARRLAALLASSGNDADWQRAVGLLQHAQGVADTGSFLNDRLRAILLSRRGRTRADRLRNLDAARRILLDQLNQSGERVEDSDRLLLAGIYEKEALLQEDPVQLQAARDQLRPLVDRANPSLEYLKLYVEFLLRHVRPPVAPATDTLAAQQVRSVFLDDARTRLSQLQAAQQKRGATRDTPLSVSLEAQLLKADDRTDDAIARVGQFAEKQAATLKDDLERARFYLSMGKLYASLSRPAGAEIWYRKLMSIAPAAYRMVARSLADQGRVEEAVQVCLQAAKDQASADVAATLAQLLTLHDEDMKSAADAESLIAAAVETHGDNAQLLQQVAVLHVSRGQTDDALLLFRRIVERLPDNVLALNNLATLLGERSNQRTEALETIDRAIEIAGRLPALLDTRGTIFLLAGDAAEAVTCLEESVAGGAADPRYYLHLAAAYQLTGQVDMARDSLEQSRQHGLDGYILTESDRQFVAELEESLAAEASTNR